MIKIGKFIVDHPILYYLLNYTWGLATVILGYLLTLILLPFSKVKYYKGTRYLKTRFSGNWGLSLGVCIFTSCEDDIETLIPHEFGHTIQNAMFGPFQIIICICSFIHFCRYTNRLKHNKPVGDYDSVWFEGTATKLGSLVL